MIPSAAARIVATAAFAFAGVTGASDARAQDPGGSATLVARADSLADADPAGALALVRRALPLLPRGDSLRHSALRIRCWAAITEEPDSALAWATAGIAEATAANDQRSAGFLTLCRGTSRELKGNELPALADYDSIVAVARRSRIRDLLARALVLRGELGYQRGDFTTAVRDLNESYQLYTALRDASNMRYALNAVANLYADSRMAQYDRALEYYRQLLAEHEAAGRLREVAIAHFNIGSTYETMGRLDEALPALRRALAVDEQRGDAAEVAADRRAVAAALYKLGRPSEALRELGPALAYHERARDSAGVARVKLTRGITLRMLGRTAEAIADLEAAHAHYGRAANRRYLEKIHEERGLAYAQAGRWRDAYDARVAQLAAQKALEAEAREEQSARLRVQFESAKKEAENRALSRENEATARVRRLQLVVIALAGIIIVALATYAVRQVLASRRLRLLAMVDDLTGVANRRAILQLAENRGHGALAGGEGFALLAVDVDHFKQVNDRFGHEAGDRVLRDVADACRGALRPGDHVGRTGGEEFLVILPGASAEAAREVAERLRSAVAARDFSDIGGDVAMTVSVGASVWYPADKSVADVLRRADASLYEVKRAGRNRVLVASGA